MATASSLRYLGWIWSGPGDLSIFGLLISLVTSVSVIINGGILCSISLGGINGISPSGSFVKTWQKKFDNISAFSLSLLVNSDLGSSGCRARSPMQLLVFDLKFMYCQIAFGVFLAFLARSLSNAFFSLLVRLLTWFLTLLYWCLKFSYSFLSVGPPFRNYFFCTIHFWDLSYLVFSCLEGIFLFLSISIASCGNKFLLYFHYFRVKKFPHVLDIIVFAKLILPINIIYFLPYFFKICLIV